MMKGLTVHHPDSAAPRWLHLLAVLTACATLPLLSLGAEVTTRGVGMVDPRGFRWPWEIVALLADGDNRANSALVIELTHRMFGFLVGLLAIALCAGTWLAFRDRRRWLGPLALVAVVAQGLLGRYRVDLNDLLGYRLGSVLALVHGCFAQLVFALLVGVAVLTSPAWAAPGRTHEQAPARLRYWSLLTAGVIFVQIVLGAVVRHRDLVLGARLHLLGAFAVAAAVVWLVKVAGEQPSLIRRRWVVLLAGLVGLQLLLGVETWLSKFTAPGTSWNQLQPLVRQHELVRTLHFVAGALLFSTSVAVALWAYRLPSWTAQAATPPARRLEGAA
jgi:heme A synthase